MFSDTCLPSLPLDSFHARNKTLPRKDFRKSSSSKKRKTQCSRLFTWVCVRAGKMKARLRRRRTTWRRWAEWPSWRRRKQRHQPSRLLRRRQQTTSSLSSCCEWWNAVATSWLDEASWWSFPPGWKTHWDVYHEVVLLEIGLCLGRPSLKGLSLVSDSDWANLIFLMQTSQDRWHQPVTW